MTDLTALFPNETYYDGLRRNDANTFESLYTEFRRPVSKAVTAAGGSSADGFTFFRVALIQAAGLARDKQLDETVPIYAYLETLALAHFRDWALEKELETLKFTKAPEAEPAPFILLPSEIDREAFRQRIKAKRQFNRLETRCQKVVQNIVQDAASTVQRPETADCLKQYKQNLDISAETAEAGLIPDFAVTALTDQFFGASWIIAEGLESRLSMGLSATPESQSKVTRNVLIALVLILLSYGVYCYLNPSISPKQVYQENYTPPTSIMEDRAARLAKDSVPAETIPLCEQLFEEADTYYKQEAYNDAASVLYTMIAEDTEACKSDALFYLAIIGLQMEEPGLTIECLAKIPDLERFGEDLYWYQALAFVKIAAQNPLRKGNARRAVERARSNTEIPERRAQAEKMLEQLAE